jgi:hypothetical protein
MKQIVALIGLFAAFGVSAAPPSCDQYEDERILVAKFFDELKGVANDGNYPLWSGRPPELDEMVSKPVGSSCWLVRELGETRKTLLLLTEARLSHPVWAIRALGYITSCRHFYGALAPDPAIDTESVRWDFLLRKGWKRVPYFVTWMSRDTVRLAPLSVQRVVIRKWQDWYKNDAATFPFAACEEIDDWYF